MIYTYDVTNEFISDLDTKNYTTKEILKIDNNNYKTSLFKIVLKKNIDDKKKEEFNVWLDDESKIILKVSYSKFGDWEYIVKKIKKI